VDSEQTVTTVERPTSKLAIAAVIAAVALVIGYFALGMPGMDHSTGTSTGHDMSAMTPTISQLSADEFSSAMAADDDAYVMNVHVPYEGEIGDTDAFVAFDKIENSADLPSDRSQPIRLYCKTGRMSQIAGLTLVQMGYTDVAHLVGGMDAWAESGRAVFGEA
jgi:rhodanese-related sulfurtransferase